MSKKHFESIASALKIAKPEHSAQPEAYVWRSLVRSIANVCKDSNPSFDLDRFLAACGY